VLKHRGPPGGLTPNNFADRKKGGPPTRGRNTKMGGRPKRETETARALL